ncbi:hypothetical protein HYX14_01695 [Candidatus Woesearchaeota archaeon]|nr:hypothetical protein [Candidatus Woesearchaeota archaeon]
MNTITFFHDKKGMEMWQLMMIILGVLLLLFLLSWYFLLNQDLGGLFARFGEMF